ncbi:MAG: hypothetical protein K9J13_00870 [Saprospiraceae bacterium]|nr:hypothetical protein [Saprospiraceae bacterium]
MISSINIKFREDEIELLSCKLSECDKVLKIKYPYRTTLLMIFCEFLFVFFVYLAETNNFQILLLIFVLLTIVPVWVIISSLILYFGKRIPVLRLNKKYKKYQAEGEYECLLIQSQKCEKFLMNNIDYLIFHIDSKTILLFRQQDFTIDDLNFPSDKFIIPPRELYDIVGNKIIVQGSRIKTLINNSELVQKYFRVYDMIEHGHVYFLDLNK